jgi:hypothetical protein
MPSGLKSGMSASPHLTSVISGRERMETEKPAPLPFCGGLQKATGVAGGVAMNSPSISGQILNIAGNRVERWRQGPGDGPRVPDEATALEHPYPPKQQSR